MEDMIYDPSVIPDWSGQFPAGRAHVRIEAIDWNEPTRTGKAQIRVTLRGLEPLDVKDQPHFERFVIGTDTDPAGTDPNSWTGFAARRYKDMLSKAGVHTTGSVRKDAEAAIGQSLGIVITNEVQGEKDRQGNPNPYAGRVQANIRSFFMYGSQPVGDGGYRPPEPKAQAATPAAQPAATRVARPAPAVAQPPAPAASLVCQICNKAIPKTMFAAHVAAHEAAEE